MMTFGKEAASKAKAFQISPEDTNYFAVVFDPQKDRAGQISLRASVLRLGRIRPCLRRPL